MALLWQSNLCRFCVLRCNNRLVKSLKGEIKKEVVIYSFVVFQWGLLTSHILWKWPNLYFAVLPSIILIGCYVVIMTAYLIGLCRINANHIIKKRSQIAIAGIASFSFLLFLIHITDKYSNGKSVPELVLCIEFIIPEVFFLFRYK